MKRAPSSFVLACLGVAVLMTACSTVSTDRPRTRERGTGSAQILVTLPPTMAAPWNELAAELAGQYGLHHIAGWKMQALGVHCLLFESGSPLQAELAVRQMRGDPRVESVQLNQRFEARSQRAVSYDDPHLRLQYGAASLGLPAAHQWATGRGVRVAVVDTGVDVGHEDLGQRIVGAKNFVRDDDSFTSDRHGTAVAGVIAAVANNGRGIVGVAPGADIYALKACWYPQAADAQAVCTSYTLALALDHAISVEAQVLNLSLQGPSDPLLSRLVEEGLRLGIIVVAAAGDPGGFPAEISGVIRVRACDAQGEPWPALDASAAPAEGRLLVAPGVEVLSLAPRNAYDFVSGSSIAAAHISGIVALLLERNPRLGPEEVAELLWEGAGAHSAASSAQVEVASACGSLGALLGQSCPSPLTKASLGER